MKFRAIIWVAAVGLASCTQNDPSVEGLPEGYLSREEIVPVVAEMEVLQSVHNNRLIAQEETQDSLPVYYQQIFEKHGLERALFDSSYKWHTSTSDRSIALHEGVVDYLKKWEDGRTMKDASADSIP